jgi:hypothetical protein
MVVAHDTGYPHSHGDEVTTEDTINNNGSNDKRPDSSLISNGTNNINTISNGANQTNSSNETKNVTNDTISENSGFSLNIVLLIVTVVIAIIGVILVLLKKGILKF